MSEPNELDLGPIKARLEAATPGPWRWADWHADFGTPEDIENKRWLEHNPNYDFTNVSIVREKDDESQEIIELMDRPDAYNESNLDLIANAPTDIAALVAEVERLRANQSKVLSYLETFHGADRELIENVTEVLDGK